MLALTGICVVLLVINQQFSEIASCGCCGGGGGATATAPQIIVVQGGAGGGGGGGAGAGAGAGAFGGGGFGGTGFNAARSLSQPSNVLYVGGSTRNNNNNNYNNQYPTNNIRSTNYNGNLYSQSSNKNAANTYTQLLSEASTENLRLQSDLNDAKAEIKRIQAETAANEKTSAAEADELMQQAFDAGYQEAMEEAREDAQQKTSPNQVSIDMDKLISILTNEGIATSNSQYPLAQPVQSSGNQYYPSNQQQQYAPAPQQYPLQYYPTNQQQQQYPSAQTQQQIYQQGGNNYYR